MSNTTSPKTTSIILEQERDFGTKISACFTFIGATFRPFIKSVLFFVSPLAVLAGIFGGLYQSKAMDSILNPVTGGGNTSGFGTNPFLAVMEAMNSKGIGVTSPQYLLMLLFTILGSIAMTIISFAAMRAYRADGEISVDSIWENFKQIFGKTLLTMVVNFLFLMALILVVSVFGGLLFSTIASNPGKVIAVIVLVIIIFVPLMYFGIVFSLSPAITAFEGTRPMEAIRRAFFLIKDKWWSTFGLLMTLALVSSFMGYIFTIPAAIIPLLKGFGVISNSPITNFLIILTTVFSMLGTFLLSALGHFGLGFQYFNLVERKEGTGLLQQISTIGTTLKPSEEEDEY
jgi:hypothetical protein